MTGIDPTERRRMAIRDQVADRMFAGDFHAADNLISKLYSAGLDLERSEIGNRHGPWPFVLTREEDLTGVSGTGVVAEGVEFTGGVVALRWLSDWPTSVVFHDKGIESVEAVHGHGGKTRMVWL